ncbi:MoaB/Mog domain-containing protein [Kickxella alabastrina]|uniref:MoaB/Mog domain-containing protein n=1 Tax=Kickxella alabastrina TaxID=61397 RepID=UPI00221FFB59|nr:MoaB/Mog domain-containing protein [Kickxella alabastrina]KAI7834867.1 MoaB/Mog domain-containing protein [Kickxella alabastrina]
MLARTAQHWRPFRQLGRLRPLSASTTSPAASPTAALCVIGDEILSGKTQDTNSQVFAQHCFSLGIDVRAITTIPDSASSIASTLQALSAAHTLVFTSGGIGPTHDDITYAAVAKAFNAPLKHHAETLARMRRMMGGARTRPDPQGSEAERACARMALLPSSAANGCVAFPCDALWVPVVRVANVHVLPGVPRLFAQLLAAYLPTVAGGVGVGVGAGFVRVLVGTRMRESDVAPALARLQRVYAPKGLKLGSYPNWAPPGQDPPGQDPPGQLPPVVISAVGRDPEQLEQCRKDLCLHLNGFDIAS